MSDEIEASAGPEPAGESVHSVGGASVDGERDIPSVNRARSMQSRVNSALALTVMVLVGGGFLYFYYSNLSHKQADAKSKQLAAQTAKAAGEMKLPPLGAVDNPQAVNLEEITPPDQGPTPIGDVMGPNPPSLGAMNAPSGSAATAVPMGGPAVKTPAQLALERQLTPSVFLKSSEAPLAAAPSEISQTGAPPGVASDRAQLPSYLTPTVATSTRAQVLATRRFIIPRGNFLDCTLETAISSELPGLTTCVTAFDIFGADGKVVLIERGSKLVGETRGQVTQGMSRLFILWSEVRTPSGVVVQLDSPGTDELGRSGVTGAVDNHFFARFGAAILLTIIDGALQGVIQNQESKGSTVVLNPQGGQQVVDDILRNSINIPPTINVNQGTRVQVIVAKDVDFRSVYELRTAALQQ